MMIGIDAVIAMTTDVTMIDVATMTAVVMMIAVATTTAEGTMTGGIGILPACERRVL